MGTGALVAISALWTATVVRLLFLPVWRKTSVTLEWGYPPGKNGLQPLALRRCPTAGLHPLAICPFNPVEKRTPSLEFCEPTAERTFL
ncbi:Hypothetical protein NTJ_00309 [Nesidiocoris tenuis]|uniref:Secreted protein n=1 Tax=Nesidiocoris tenuis TaxID=355587 RepID=A0ABN7A6H5_9HEMI|nr:Hypothetical protein NTJ_00309 [Nesidiocoris tenuis]